MTYQSKWRRFGEHRTLKRLLDGVFIRILEDPLLREKFAGVDVEERIKPHFAKLIMFLLGALTNYDLARLREAHSKLGITDEQFSRVVVHFAAELITQGVPPDIIMDLAVAAQSTRELVVSRPARTGVQLFYIDQEKPADEAIVVLNSDVPEQIAFDVCVGLRRRLAPGIALGYNPATMPGM